MERKNIQEVFAYNHGLGIEASFILRNEIIFSDMEIGRGFDGRMSLLIGKGFASFAVDVSKARFSGIVFIRYQEDVFFPYEIVHGQFSVDVSHEDDATSQAECQAQQVDDGVWFASQEEADGVCDYFHISFYL